MPVVLLTPGTISEQADGNAAWTNPNNMIAEDGSDATVMGNATTPRSNAIHATNFSGAGSISDDATVTGLRIRFFGRCTTAGFTGTILPRMEDVQLIVGGTPTGDTEISGSLSSAIDVVRYAPISGTTLFGLTPTMAQVKASNFGVRFIFDTNATPNKTGTDYLDSVRIELTYTEPAAPEGGGGVGGRRFTLTGDFGDRRPGGIHGR